MISKMVKNVTVISSLIFLLSFQLSHTPLPKYEVAASSNTNCETECPTIHWTWQTQKLVCEGYFDYKEKIIKHEGHFYCDSGWQLDGNKCKKFNEANSKWKYENAQWSDTKYKCPDGYDYFKRDDNCRKWIEAKYETKEHEAYVVYEKSSDPNKCHRPSDNTLKNVYKMNHDARQKFKNRHHEWKAATIKSCPTSFPTATPIVNPTPTDVTHPTLTPVVTDTPVPTSPVNNTPVPTSQVTETPVPTTAITGTPVPTAISTPSENVTPTQIVSGMPTPTSAPAVGGDNGGSPNNPPAICADLDPGPPANLRATALGGGKVRLDWDHTPGPHTSYAVAYGPEIGQYIYGDPNVGNVTTYTVQALNPGGRYCFYVQAQNGCRGGSPSNVVCTNQGAGSLRVLGASTNYNPLVEGIKNSFGGEVLGATTELMRTAEVAYSSEKLPSGNTMDSNKSISIPSLGLTSNIYYPQSIGDELTVGHREVLNTKIAGSDVYYGHNGTDIFGKLYTLKTGDKVTLNNNGSARSYKIVTKDFVNKADVESVSTTKDQIVLVTCSYTKPDSRIVIKAELEK